MVGYRKDGRIPVISAPLLAPARARVYSARTNVDFRVVNYEQIRGQKPPVQVPPTSNLDYTVISGVPSTRQRI